MSCFVTADGDCDASEDVQDVLQGRDRRHHQGDLVCDLLSSARVLSIRQSAVSGQSACCHRVALVVCSVARIGVRSKFHMVTAFTLCLCYTSTLHIYTTSLEHFHITVLHCQVALMLHFHTVSVFHFYAVLVLHSCLMVALYFYIYITHPYCVGVTLPNCVSVTVLWQCYTFTLCTHPHCKQFNI